MVSGQKLICFQLDGKSLEFQQYSGHVSELVAQGCSYGRGGSCSEEQKQDTETRSTKQNSL